MGDIFSPGGGVSGKKDRKFKYPDFHIVVFYSPLFSLTYLSPGAISCSAKAKQNQVGKFGQMLEPRAWALGTNALSFSALSSALSTSARPRSLCCWERGPKKQAFGIGIETSWNSRE